MLSIYDLYDLHAIFYSIRFSPADITNYDIVCNVRSVLEKRHLCNDINQFRKSLRKIPLLNQELYSFVYIDNRYTYFSLPFLKNEKIYVFLIKACDELLNVIIENNTEKIADLADCLHNLPIIIVENNYSIPKSYYENELKTYQKKWGKLFLS